MKTLIDKINRFESLPVSSVTKFNEIFPQCKLEGLDGNLEVEIGELADSDTARFLLVGSLIIKHSFQPARDTVEVEVDGGWTDEKIIVTRESLARGSSKARR